MNILEIILIMYELIALLSICTRLINSNFVMNSLASHSSPKFSLYLALGDFCRIPRFDQRYMFDELVVNSDSIG